MTNTQNMSGRHRTEEPFGVVITRESHSHAGGTPVAGQIMARAWSMAADAVRADMEARRALRAIPAVPQANKGWSTCFVCSKELSNPTGDCGSMDERHRKAREG